MLPELHDLYDIWDYIDDHGTNRDASRKLCLADRYYLLVKVLNRTDCCKQWIYERCREVEDNPDGYIDIWAREHYKSTIITYAGIIQEILRNPEIRIGIFSHTKSVSRAFVFQIKKELESNENLLWLFGEDILYENPSYQSPSWSINSGLIVKRVGNPKEPTLQGYGLVDGMPTGLHFDLRVYDDVVTKSSVNTPEQVSKTTEMWELSDNLGTIGGRSWIVGTRYSYGDTYAAIMEREAAIPRIHPATKDGTLTGEPVLWSQDYWRKKLLKQGEATASCQLLCNPLAGRQKMFDVEDLRVYEIRPETLNLYLMVDPARSVKKDSANTAMVLIGVDYAGNKFLLDGYDHKMDLQERWMRMRDLWRNWRNAAGVAHIKVGYERFGAIADLDYFRERQRIEKIRFDIEELAWPREGLGSKIDRVQRIGPDLRMAKIFVPYETNPDRLTSLQRQMNESGYSYRMSKQIRKKDNDGNMYDLTERFRQQIYYFPFGGLVDVVDAFSRIYDMEPNPPRVIRSSSLEPEYI